MTIEERFREFVREAVLVKSFFERLLAILDRLMVWVPVSGVYYIKRVIDTGRQVTSSLGGSGAAWAGSSICSAG